MSGAQEARDAVGTALEGLAAVATVRGDHRLAALRLGAAAVRRLDMEPLPGSEVAISSLGGRFSVRPSRKLRPFPIR